MKYQNYLHYKLPITINPLEYGKLIEQFDSKFIIQLNTNNVVIVEQIDNTNLVKFFRKGELMFEYSDLKISDLRFERSILDQRYIFEKNKLISTQILNELSQITIYENITPLSNKNTINFEKTYLENTYIFKNYPVFTFILFKLSLLLLVYIIFFVIIKLPEENITVLSIIPFKNKISHWDNFVINIRPSVFNKELLKTNLNKFWSEIVELKISENQHMLLMFRLQWTDNQFVSIGNLQKLNNTDKDYIFNYIMEEIKDKSEYYLEYSIISITFSYGIRDGRAPENRIITKVQHHNYQHHKLPITMNPLEYGKLVKRFNNIYNIQLNDKNDVFITQFDNYNDVEFYRSGNLVYKWLDKWINNETFSRILGKKEFIFRNNEQLLAKIEKPSKFLSNINLEDQIVNKFITMDIETFIKDNVHIPYCISWFDGENSFSYYLTDFKDSDSMIITCMNELLTKKYDNYKIYIHNLARFDSIFLLKILANLGYVKPIIHNNKIISITFGLNSYIVQFKDSKQLLLNSLRDLGKSFDVDTQKSIFPYSFVNENNLNYNAWLPEFKYFDGISNTEYLNYSNEFKYTTWNLKNETVKYCEIDCVSLYQIVSKFNELIFERFKINIHKYPTLSSLAFAIFRSGFLLPDTISQLSGQVAKDIRAGYTGGAVDMYIPENPDGTKIYVYDVNSLYPSVMKDYAMPIGKPTLFEGNIRDIDTDAFEFFYCKIKAPNYLEHPILQTHVKTDNGFRTIAPLGQWEDMIFSAEMDNAVKYGYEFEILWGYTFEKGYIFNEYIDNFYNLRLKYPKTNPLNLISKLLLNSLYGRFGMDDNFMDISILSKKNYNKFEKDHVQDILDILDLGEKILVKHRSIQKQIDTLLDNASENHNVNISIAAAITAYARIHMSQFKNNPNFNLFYSDTDSIYIDKPLPNYLINNKILGKMKLEYVVDKAIFLAPKVYYLETINNETIYKVKGLSHKIELTKHDFKFLLNKDHIIEKSQTKWIKSLSEGNIQVLEQLYTLSVTDNKRKLIFENNKLINSKPYIINEDKDILNK